MKITVLTAIVLAAALVHGSQGQLWSGSGSSNNFGGPQSTIQPCQQRSSVARYQDFVYKHVLTKNFDRRDLGEWEDYLDEPPSLCGRVPVQTFIDAPVGQVDQVCRGGGRRVRGATGSKGNLCISVARMSVYDVASQKGNTCIVTSVRPRRINVVLACNKVNNNCLPVHYEKNRGQQPTGQQCL